MDNGDVDEKTAETDRAALKDMLLQKKVEARKRRENKKSSVETFDEYFRESRAQDYNANRYSP